MKTERLATGRQVPDGTGRKDGLHPGTPSPPDPQAEEAFGPTGLDHMWGLLLRNVKELRLETMDFSDLWEDEDGHATGDGQTASRGAEPPGSPLAPPPPPPLPCPPLGGGLPIPPPPPGSPFPPRPGASSQRKTLRLFWNELRNLPPLPKYSRFGPLSIWASLETRPIDTNKLQHLFQCKTREPQQLKKRSVGTRPELTVLCVKRSNVINIGLTSLPAPHIVRAALLSFDECVLEKEAIERLQTMVPTVEELERIRDAQRASPLLPLGSAEQFLLTLASVSELPARLQLWSFKQDYDTKEKAIAEPLFNLKLGMEQLAGNKTFHCILATLLAIGNFLNGVNAKGFELSYLEKVPGVKDTVHKLPLLHHACAIIIENYPDTTDLYSEITALTRSAKVDFGQLQTDLTQLEDNCKAAWDHLKSIAKRDNSPVFKSRTPAFLKECAQSIIVLKAVHRRIRSRFHSFLLYFGYPSSSLHKVTVGKFCKLISDFALDYRTAQAQILQQRERQEREQERLLLEDGERASSPLSITALIRDMCPDVSRRHEHMKEILNTPERTRKYDYSLPRSRSKKAESTGFTQKKYPW